MPVFPRRRRMDGRDFKLDGRLDALGTISEAQAKRSRSASAEIYVLWKRHGGVPS